MSLKTATRTAIYMIAFGLLLAVAEPWFNEWVTTEYKDGATGFRIMQGFYIVNSLLTEGGILIFLISVAKSQK